MRLVVSLVCLAYMSSRTRHTHAEKIYPGEYDDIISPHVPYKSWTEKILKDYSTNPPPANKSCLQGCPRISDPWCGTDGRTAGNWCDFEIYLCEAAKRGEGLGIAHKEACFPKGFNEKCYGKRKEVCDSRGETHRNGCYLAKAVCKAKENGQVITAVKEGPCRKQGGYSDQCCRSNCYLYRGKQSTSISGWECQPWNSLDATHEFHPDKHPNAGLDWNYCRNPSKADAAWCFVKKSGVLEKEDCPVPKCVEASMSVGQWFENLWNKLNSGTRFSG